VRRPLRRSAGRAHVPLLPSERHCVLAASRRCEHVTQLSLRAHREEGEPQRDTHRPSSRPRPPPSHLVVRLALLARPARRARPLHLAELVIRHPCATQRGEHGAPAPSGRREVALGEEARRLARRVVLRGARGSGRASRDVHCDRGSKERGRRAQDAPSRRPRRRLRAGPCTTSARRRISLSPRAGVRDALQNARK